MKKFRNYLSEFYETFDDSNDNDKSIEEYSPKQQAFRNADRFVNKIIDLHSEHYKKRNEQSPFGSVFPSDFRSILHRQYLRRHHSSIFPNLAKSPETLLTKHYRALDLIKKHLPGDAGDYAREVLDISEDEIETLNTAIKRKDADVMDLPLFKNVKINNKEKPQF